MKTGHYAGLALAAASLLAWSGCSSTTVNTIEPADRSAQPHMISDQRVLTDQSLNKRVQLVGLNTATGPEGFLKVQAQLHNVTRKAANFTYRVEWYDENGMLIQLPTAAAMPRTIEGGEILPITFTAPTPKAKDFRVKFLEPTTR